MEIHVSERERRGPKLVEHFVGHALEAMGEDRAVARVEGRLLAAQPSVLELLADGVVEGSEQCIVVLETERDDAFVRSRFPDEQSQHPDARPTTAQAMATLHTSPPLRVRAIFRNRSVPLISRSSLESECFFASPVEKRYTPLVMPSTIAAIDPATGNRGLLVEVHPELTQVAPDVVRAFSERMFLRNVRVGLIVARTDTVVLRDTLSSMEFRDNRYERHRLDTGALFAGARVAIHALSSESEFVKCVVQTLEAIGSSWYSFLHESAIPAMVPDVVGNLAQANLEVWDGLLERHDAAE